MRIISLLLLILFPSAAYAVDVNMTWDPNPSSEQVTHYQCEYQKNAGPFVACDADIVGETMYTQPVLDANSEDIIGVRLRACNVIGCSAFTQTVTDIVPPDVAPSAPIYFQVVVQ
jgi:hypothetical protein